MSLTGRGLRRFEAKMAETHLFQTKSRTRRSLSGSSVAMWSGKRAESHHVVMRRLLLACGERARGEVGTRNGGKGGISIGLRHLMDSKELNTLYHNEVVGHSTHR